MRPWFFFEKNHQNVGVDFSGLVGKLHIDILPHNHPIPIILKSERFFFCQQFFTPPDHDFTKNLRPTVGRRAKKKVDSREFYIILEGISKLMVCGYHIRFMCDGLPMSDTASCDSTVPFCFSRPTSADVGRLSADVG